MRCERVSPEQHVARFHRCLGQTHHKYCVVCCQMLLDVRLAPRSVCGVDVVRGGPDDRELHVECGTCTSCAREKDGAVRFSFENHMFPRPQFQISERLSIYERLLVASVHTSVWVVRLRLGQLGFKGNAVCFEAKTKEFARRLPNLPGSKFIQCVPAGRRNQHAATAIRLRLIEYAFFLLVRFHKYYMDHPENPYGQVELDPEIMKRLPQDGFVDDVGLADAAGQDGAPADGVCQMGLQSARSDAGGVRVALSREEAPDFVTHKMWEAWANGETGLAKAFTSATLGCEWLKAAWGDDAYSEFESGGVASLHEFARGMKLGYDPANRAKSQMRRFCSGEHLARAGDVAARVEAALVHLIGCCTVNAAPCSLDVARDVFASLSPDAFGAPHVVGDCWEAFVSGDVDGRRKRGAHGVLLANGGGRDFLMREASVGLWIHCGAQSVDTFSAIAAYCGRAATDRVPLV